MDDYTKKLGLFSSITAEKKEVKSLKVSKGYKVRAL